MSLKFSYEIKCVCKKNFTAELCEYVFAEYDAELKDKILSGEFNCVECPECGEKIYAETRFLYRDEKNSLWIWVYKDNERDLREQILNEIFDNKGFLESHYIDNHEDYKQYLVFGINELLAILLNEDDSVKNILN